MEGILMRGPKKEAIVCRDQETGGFKTKVEELTPLGDKYPILKVPFVRGIGIFISSMAHGMQALTWSMDQLPEEMQEEPSKLDLWLQEHLSSEKAEKAIIGVGVVLGVLLAVGLFVLLPAFIFELLPDGISLVGRCIIEGIFRIIIFFLYLWLCTRMKEIKRVFSYHGAEHKTIFCYEKRLELTVENVRKQSRFHPRCGTSFLVVIMIISIFVISFMTWVISLIPGIADLPTGPATLVRMVMKLIMIPIIMGITYELNRWVGRHDELLIAKILAWPGKMTQHLTTFEPDDSMIECAIEAMKLVIPEEEGLDRW